MNNPSMAILNGRSEKDEQPGLLRQALRNQPRWFEEMGVRGSRRGPCGSSSS